MKKYKATLKEQKSYSAEEEVWIVEQLYEDKNKKQDNVFYNLKLWSTKTSTRKFRL